MSRNMPRRAASAAVALALILAAVPAVSAGAQASAGPQEAAAGGSLVDADRLYRLHLWVPVPREAVYDAWTTADQFVEWFAHEVEMTVAPGGSYSMWWEGYEGAWQGEYIEVERPSTLSFTWAPPAAVYPEGAYPTTVRLTFEEDEDEGGTHLTLEHSGFRATGEMEPVLEAWRAYLFNLRAFLLRRAAAGAYE